MRFLGIQRGMDASEDYISSALTRQFTDFVSAERISGMYPNADNISPLDAVGDYSDQRFVDKNRITKREWRSRG
jgi:nucleoid-associated protein YejK